MGTDSNTLAKLLVDEIVCRYGMPEIIHSDQESNFVSEVIRSLCAMMGVQCTQTTPYHPQGMAKWSVSIGRLLSKVVSDHQRDWDEHLQKVLFAYRTAIHESTGYSPFLVTFGRSPNLPVDVVLGRPSTSTGDVPQFVQKTQCCIQRFYMSANIFSKHIRDKSKRLMQAVLGKSFRLGTEYGFMSQK